MKQKVDEAAKNKNYDVLESFIDQSYLKHLDKLIPDESINYTTTFEVIAFAL